MALTSVRRDHHEIDAHGASIGRLATRVALLLRGKHKATYLPSVDAGDFVHVKNLRTARFTGRKLSTEIVSYYTGYPGGRRSESLGTKWSRDATEVLRAAVFGMLPRNTLRERMMRRLTIDE